VDDKTRNILNIFEQINKIPRCSKKEAKISQWLLQWANDKGLTFRKDSPGNIIIKIAATKGAENAPGIIIQGHLDMVCEKTENSDHDFSSDPIQCVYDGDWLKGRQTTLGADNGIAIALGLAIADDPEIVHPSLELLFTVEEESGLLGAKAMDQGFAQGRILLNVDSEDEGVFTIGCAGGEDTRIHLALDFEELPAEISIYRLSASGMRGGHSGIDIHKPRASANKILARALHLLAKSGDMRLMSIKGGTVHNAIARDAEATVVMRPSQFARMQNVIKEFEQTVLGEYATSETSLALSISQVAYDSDSNTALPPGNTHKAIQLLLALPHGVTGMSEDPGNLVETSNNLATVEIKNKSLEILSSQRSSMLSRLEEITARVGAAANLAGAEIKNENRYPAWQPDLSSPVLKRSQEVYQKLFSKTPRLQTIHAGLECGIIGSKHENMDMISFGPTIENPHSPDERLFIPSIARVWDFLIALLASYTS
jgi:dipeptidase D